MSYLLLAIVASVCVSIFLKLARKYQLDIAQAILVNYITALFLCLFLLKPDFSVGFNLLAVQGSFIFVALGFLLPSVFIIMARAVDIAGIAKSDIAQRLALFLPILAAFTIFGEMITLAKALGVVLAFLALMCLVYKSNETNRPKSTKSYSVKNTALILLGVWLGYGVIDILFKQMSKLGNAFSHTLFVSFALALILMTVYLLFNKTKWHGKSLLSGVLLGALNFANIFYYIKAHQNFKDDPTLVFVGMNIGVISLGVVIGLVVFKEKINKINALGIVFGVMSIACLFYLDKFLI